MKDKRLSLTLAATLALAPGLGCDDAAAAVVGRSVPGQAPSVLPLVSPASLSPSGLSLDLAAVPAAALVAPVPALDAGIAVPSAAEMRPAAEVLRAAVESLSKAAINKDKEATIDSIYSGSQRVAAGEEEADPVDPGPKKTPSAGKNGGLKPSPRGLAVSPAEQRVLEKITQDLGPIVEEADAPAIYATLNVLFERLSVAQKTLFPADMVSINRVYIVDTPAPNAFVLALKAPGVRRSSNMVFITTGLLKKMLDEDPALLKSGVARVAGALAHELAHPLDDVDPEGIKAHHGREIGSQAREIRADSEGVMIAKEAGYPIDGVYESLQRLFAGSSGAGLLAAAASTHPQDDLRLAMQRMLLTLDRYEKGIYVPRYPEEAPPAMLEELKRLDKGAIENRFTPPRTLAEALDRLKNVSEIKRGEVYKILEFNRLLLSADALLAKKGSELGDEDFRLFTDMSRLLSAGGTPDVLDRKGMNRLFTEESGSAEFLAYPSHMSFMKKIPAYGSPRYLKWISENFFTKKDDRFRELTKTLEQLAKILPSEHIFALFSERIAADMPSELRTHPNRRYIYDRSIAEKHSPEFQARLAALFHKKVLPALSEEERIAFFIDSTHDTYSYVFPQFGSRETKDYSRGVLKDRVLLMADPRLRPLQEDFREAMRGIWENRGYYGVLDLIVSFNSTDWDTVFETLGIDGHVGRSSLRRAVKEFTKTPAFVSVLRMIRDSELDAFRYFKMGLSIGKRTDVEWADDTLAAYLSGDENEALSSDPELRAFAKQVFAAGYYAERTELFRKKYRRRLADALAALPAAGMSLERLAAVHEDIRSRLLGGARTRFNLEDIQAEVIDGSALPAQDKKRLLEAVFLEGHGDKHVRGLTYDIPGAWLNGNDADSAEAVLRVLAKNGLSSGPLDLFARLLAKEEFRKAAKGGGWTNYFSAVSSFKEELLQDLEKSLSQTEAPAEKRAILKRFAETVVDPADAGYPAPETVNTPELRDIKSRVAALAGSLDMGFEEALGLFRRLTGSGPTPATDAFFRKRLEADFDDGAAASAGLPLSELLKQGRIAGAGLQLSLTRRYLEPELRRLEGRKQEPGVLNRLVETLNAYVRQGSLKKDEFLESLAWRLNLGGSELGAFIEDEKSYNWRKANPLLLRFGSALSAEIANLSPKSREDFLRFLIAPEGRELPGALFKELKNNIYAAALALDAAKESHRSRAEIKKESDRAAYLMKLEIEAALIDASPFERIPLFELLLSAGPRALRNAPDFPGNVTRDFLGYAPGSTEEKMLAAFLDIVPTHERTVSLAYLLSQAGENKTSVNHIFEVFQTVGVKFGQMSSTWKLFGEEVARETASLKNAARPMTKAEILEAARRELTPGEFARIARVKRVAGSASLKTVAVVELENGREAVMLLRRPHAAEQIESNLRLGSAFLKELDRRGLSYASAMFESVLDAVRGQLAEEIRMTREARRIREAKAHFEKLNGSMRSTLGGWRFSVPDLVEGFQERDTLLFIEKAEGTTFDRLSPELRAQAGPLIAESSLALLFRKGWFDADRHTGNQLIDPERKIIYPIDFGQATDFSRGVFWKRDDRYELAQFIRALSAGDSDALISHGRAMAGGGEPKDLSALAAEVSRILTDGHSPADRLVSLVAAFAAAGLPLEGRFTFGAFKGLLTLYGEGYVPDEDFRQRMAREIALLLKKKFPPTLLERFRARQSIPR